jgi:hypothetical protein
MTKPAGTHTDDKAALGQIRAHLVAAQQMMDEIEPDSPFSARLQHLIDEVESQTGLP